MSLSASLRCDNFEGQFSLDIGSHDQEVTDKGLDLSQLSNGADSTTSEMDMEETRHESLRLLSVV